MLVSDENDYIVYFRLNPAEKQEVGHVEDHGSSFYLGISLLTSYGCPWTRLPSSVLSFDQYGL